MEQYSLYGVLRAKGLIKNTKLKSRLPIIMHTMIMIILSQKSITKIPRYIELGSHLVCYTAVFSVVTQGALRDDTKNSCVAD